MLLPTSMLFSLLLKVSQRPAQGISWHLLQSDALHLIWLCNLVSPHDAEYRFKKVLMLTFALMFCFSAVSIIQAYRAISGAQPM